MDEKIIIAIKTPIIILLLVIANVSLLWGNPRPVGWSLIDTLAPVRNGYKCAYDQEQNKIILFGGQDTLGQMPGDILEFSGYESYSWNDIDAPGPGGRIGHGLCYDTLYQNVFLFGGQNQTGQYLNDTWVWHNSHWTKIDSTGPAPRANFSMAYDPVRYRVVIFGGVGGDSLYRDTWEWNGDSGWELKATDGPSPRIMAGMAFDNSWASVCVLHGGQTGQNGEILNDTWIWDGQTWTQAQIGGDSPSPRLGFAIATYDDDAVLFGGRDSSDTFLDDLWYFRQAPYYQYHWSQDNFSLNTPTPRSMAIMTQFQYGDLVIIGGTNGSHILHDVWIYPVEEPDYIVGDVNNNHIFNGLDVLYSINYFRGGPPPPISRECIPGQLLYVAGDVNASCSFNGLDILYMVNYFKGGPVCQPCPDCPPKR